MAIVKPFKGVRPPQEIVKELACRPYDVLNTQEAKQEATAKSLLHITRPDIDLPVGADLHSETAYAQATENYHRFKENGYLQQDQTATLYIYAQTMNGKTQYGIVGNVSVDEYENNIIKKHELTRPDKEDDRMQHIMATNANIEPVFLTYKSVAAIDEIVKGIVLETPEYDFTDDTGVGHSFWVIKEAFCVQQLEGLFEEVGALYIADGHHRTAAAARVGIAKRAANPNHTGEEEYNYFMATIFPDNQLRIIDYNRVVKDLNGLSKKKLLKLLDDDFFVEPVTFVESKPLRKRELAMYTEGEWYKLTAKPHTYDHTDPVSDLDVTVLSEHILDKRLGIKDLRTDKRIDFVGGIRGLEELRTRVDSGEMAIAFALFPVSIEELMKISDTGTIMPPKTTWFEPKLRSGLVIHELE